ncbi:VOC family protein [Deinococcus deserti]|uniref:Putative glyoxalase/bleomycin resistance protein/dioxygenase superfamily, putative lactoylglutathione lyase n=1 Tax=Deinococcus deserti (strain DSM 17065 / CIP 109153 / LMG 22923 / VCD115) TaxID=546414 RepID=C1CY49_DEIDV|nr:VOC family protein [Deinococcus deserti]ACO47005.1 putative glyoxalase/bleomycin resistance protein/dioxygenase superfamily, putative lactoylglutathione lyase [Deinococcus deserti VCD115]
MLRALETCLYADDLALAEPFYTEVLGLTLHSKVAGRHLFYQLEGSMLLIFSPAGLAQTNGVPSHSGKAGGHACLAIARDQTDGWEARLISHGLEVTRYAWGDRGESLYFHDPAGNVLELAPPSIWGILDA